MSCSLGKVAMPHFMQPHSPPVCQVLSFFLVSEQANPGSGTLDYACL